jgi:methylated-DNA-[protein]-cysteine S-methyltransferase
MVRPTYHEPMPEPLTTPPPARLAFASLDTPVGRLWLAGGEAGLVAIDRSHGPDRLIEALQRRGLDPRPDAGLLADAVSQLAAYHAGDRHDLTLALDFRWVRPFDAAVYDAARRIQYGETASYGDLAAVTGSPRAARAVGRAMARCPFFPVVPCHRVIHADGSLGGWGSEPWVKRWYLALEQSLPFQPPVRAAGPRR